jgi:hypothetical protein
MIARIRPMQAYTEKTSLLEEHESAESRRLRY